MRTVFDLSPLYRSAVGFDHLFDMLDGASRVAETASWPPYKIEKLGDDRYRITMAAAGFAPDEIELVQQANALVVAGRKQSEPEDVQVLHRGIANRAFRQVFDLADYVKAKEARLDNGLLTVDLVREVPEAMKPRRIELAAGGGAKTIEHAGAAAEAEPAKAA